MQPNKSRGAGGQDPDLHDSAKDLAELKSEPVTFDLPDVDDIPGQENIVPLSLGELVDETLSSSDEEGEDIFGDNADREPDEDDESNVSSTERNDLDTAANDMPTDDDIHLREAALDNTDEDGAPLNEGDFKNNIAGADLDVPGTEDDNEDEDTGEEDEENNSYSLGGDNHDDIPEDNF